MASTQTHGTHTCTYITYIHIYMHTCILKLEKKKSGASQYSSMDVKSTQIPFLAEELLTIAAVDSKTFPWSYGHRKITTLWWMAPHPRTCGQHQLDSVSYKRKEKDGKGMGEDSGRE